VTGVQTCALPICLLAALLANIGIWAPRKLWVKVVAIVAAAAFLPVAYGGLAELLGRPKPMSLEWAGRDLNDAAVLGVQMRDGDAMFQNSDFLFRITTGTLFTPPNLIAHEDGGVTANSGYQNDNWDLNNLIDALAADGLVTILAEPNLTTLSGETASFLSGGEFPVPTNVTDGDTSVEFKEFGVSLAFTPTILSNNRISMRVRPEVSELSDIGAISFNGIEIPGISTRRVETTVELASGQSFAIAGLRLDARRQDNDDIPGLGNIPLFGALFQQNRLEERQQELLIVVTPYVVRPTSTQPPLPTDPYMAPRQAAAGAEANTASTMQTVPLQNGASTASASSAQTGFILE
jgi:pilus assembly protein CpaC